MIKHVEMTPVETAWVAGMVEGEGSIHIGWSWSKKIGGYRARTRLQLASTDSDVVYRLCKAAGVGSVNGPYPSPKGGKLHKPHWRWSVGKREEFIALGQRIYPHLGLRRAAQMRLALELSREMLRTKDVGKVEQKLWSAVQFMEGK